MGSSKQYELLFKYLGRSSFFQTKTISRRGALLIGLNVFRVGLFIVANLLAALCVLRQFYPDQAIPQSAKEVYLVFLAGFSAASQAELWTHGRVPSGRGEYLLILWALTTGILWVNHFCFGLPYPEEATSIVIGMVSIYTATLVSTAFQVRRRRHA